MPRCQDGDRQGASQQQRITWNPLRSTLANYRGLQAHVCDISAIEGGLDGLPANGLIQKSPHRRSVWVCRQEVKKIEASMMWSCRHGWKDVLCTQWVDLERDCAVQRRDDPNRDGDLREGGPSD
jgi:hypothetical protein